MPPSTLDTSAAHPAANGSDQSVPSPIGRGEILTVPVALLLTGVSPRVEGVNPEHARVLADLDQALPPILVHRTTLRVVDGEHRLAAAQLRGQAAIEVEFFDGDDHEAFVAAVAANNKHGLPLTLTDRKEAATRIMTSFPAWSDRLIAAKVGLSNKTVAVLRRANGDAVRPAVRVGADGRTRPLSLVDGRLRAEEVIRGKPEASLREIAAAAGISVGTAKDVRERVRKGLSPLTDGRAPVGEPAAAKTDSRTEADSGSMVESLKRDPTLRYTDDGRSLLRWLDTRVVRDDETRFAEHVPHHRAAAVASMARACATFWTHFAADMERTARGEAAAG